MGTLNLARLSQPKLTPPSLWQIEDVTTRKTASSRFPIRTEPTGKGVVHASKRDYALDTRSIVLTGPIISSCGMIMAATLGSLATTRVDLTVQLGFACATGILVDTFLVRPLLIPSFFLICERFRLRRLGLADGNSPLPVPAPAE